VKQRATVASQDFKGELGVMGVLERRPDPRALQEDDSERTLGDRREVLTLAGQASADLGRVWPKLRDLGHVDLDARRAADERA
jgi:hypothetical protein